MDFGHHNSQTLGYITSSVITLSAVDFGHHDHHTLGHLTSSVNALSSADFGHPDHQNLRHLTSSVIALSSMDFGHHNLQTSLHLTYHCTSFLKSRTITPEAWRTLNINLNWMLAALTNNRLEKMGKTLWKWGMRVFKKIGEFSASAVITRVYHIIGIFEKIKMKCFAILGCILYGTPCNKVKSKHGSDIQTQYCVEHRNKRTKTTNKGSRQNINSQACAFPLSLGLRFIMAVISSGH